MKKVHSVLALILKMSNSQKLAFAIIEHLSSQLKSGAIVGDSAESLEGRDKLVALRKLLRLII